MRFASAAVVVVAVIALAGLPSCAEPTAEPSTSVDTSEVVTPSCACGRVVPVDWNGLFANYWQPGASSMMLILHPAAAVSTLPPKFYAWLVADGTQVRVVYRVPRAAFAQFTAAVTESFTSNAQLGSNRFWGIAGGVGPGPGPIGPGPNGDPEVFSASDVGRILRTAGTMVDSTRATLAFSSTKGD